jgi:hypothetical protein
MLYLRENSPRFFAFSPVAPLPALDLESSEACEACDGWGEGPRGSRCWGGGRDAGGGRCWGGGGSRGRDEADVRGGGAAAGGGSGLLAVADRCGRSRLLRSSTKLSGVRMCVEPAGPQLGIPSGGPHAPMKTSLPSAAET